VKSSKQHVFQGKKRFVHAAVQVRERAGSSFQRVHPCMSQHAEPEPTPLPSNTLQARLKQPTKASSLCIGQEMYNDVVLPLWIRKLLLSTAAKAFANTARIEVESPDGRSVRGAAVAVTGVGWVELMLLS